MEREINNTELADDATSTTVEHAAVIEPCCEDCQIEMARNPHLAVITRERCLMGTKVTDYEEGGALSWN